MPAALPHKNFSIEFDLKVGELNPCACYAGINFVFPSEKSYTKNRQEGGFSKFSIIYSAPKICDGCDYNPHWRRGQRRFSERKRFDCTWRRTNGDVLAEQTAIEEGHAGAALYKFDEPEWKARYQDLEREVLEEHTNRTKAPTWLDVKRNLCPHYYIDLSRP